MTGDACILAYCARYAIWDMITVQGHINLKAGLLMLACRRLCTRPEEAVCMCLPCLRGCMSLFLFVTIRVGSRLVHMHRSGRWPAGLPGSKDDIKAPCDSLAHVDAQYGPCAELCKNC